MDYPKLKTQRGIDAIKFSNVISDESADNIQSSSTQNGRYSDCLVQLILLKLD